ncbi:MAG: MarR family transcriptional regulator [Proteobacteria bacterium]|nr:MarR family transcriptional regulator [Pseudomonadota bacterium]
MEYAQLNALERLAGLLRNDQRRHATLSGLQMVHHDILDYLSRCNRYSDTLQAVAEYLGLTKGTVSQSVALLAEKGYIEKKPDAADGRIQHLCLAPAGQEYIWQSDVDTRSLFEEISVSPAYARVFGTILNDILWQIQARQGMKGFGMCRSCRHNKQQEDGTFLCGLTLEALTLEDTLKICREHEFAG